MGLMKSNIRANDTVRHIPSGEEWVVCGVWERFLIPCGYPFPTMALVSDCELLEARGEPQTPEMKKALEEFGHPFFIEKEGGQR